LVLLAELRRLVGLPSRRCGGRRGRRCGGRLAEEVDPAGLLAAGLAGELAHERLRPPGQRRQRGVDRGEALEGVQPLGPRAQLTGGLRAAEQEEREDGALGVVQVEHLVEDLAVLRLAGAVARVDDPGEAEGAQLGERGRHLRVAQLHHRIPARGLVARGPQAVQGHRVGVRDRALLLEEAPEDSLLDRVQIHHWLHGPHDRRRRAAAPSRLGRAYHGQMALVIVLTSLVALAAAIRSTWSPCGLSMLSTITPIGEQARGNRYATSVAWFITGSIL